MRAQQAAVAEATGQARQTARASRPWIERWGRVGFAAHGIVYGLVGVLAVQAAAGRGGETTDTSGALPHVLEAPFGQLLLALVAIGFVGYATWRLVEAIWDPERKGTSASGIATRIGYACSAVAHAALALAAVRLLMG